MMNCIYCQQALRFTHGDILTCTNCPCDVEYYLERSERIESRNTQIIKQATWMAYHNGTLYQVTIRPSEDIKTFTHSCVIRKVINNKRPVILILNCIPWITPNSSTEQFNYILEMTNEHPKLGVQMPCYFCQAPLPISAGNLENTLFQRGGGVHGICYQCHPKLEIHHSFKKMESGYSLNYIWWGVELNNRRYNVSISIQENKFILSYNNYEWDEDVLELGNIPHITPQNCENKIKTLLVFS